MTDAGGAMDEGRRYWKAAIAHLAPEKREAAWEFYLDRLESSAAADTLGGVMLLLEAHLAFFDDLPARLGVAAQQIEATLKIPGQPVRGVLASPATGTAAQASAPSRRWRWPTFLLAGACAAIGGAAVYAVQTLHRSPALPAAANVPAQADYPLPLRPPSVRVSPWTNPANRRPQGVIVSFNAVAWTEHTSTGGANVYVLSPIEDVRRNLEALQQTSK